MQDYFAEAAQGGDARRIFFRVANREEEPMLPNCRWFVFVALIVTTACSAAIASVIMLDGNPLFDVAGAAAGILRFPLWKFLVACFLGKTPKSILVALAGAWTLEWVRDLIERYF